jgi:solute carrier family 50 protein (sugar transporter)
MSLWLQYVVPSLGCILSNVLFLSPLPKIREIDREQKLGVHNPIPYTFMLMNCLAWVVYATAWIRDDKNTAIFLFASNIIGLGLGIYYTFVCFPLIEDQSLKLNVRRVFVGLVTIFVLISFVLAIAMNDYDNTKFSLGLLANILELIFFASPLSTIFEVLRTKSAETIHLPLTITSLVATSMWVIYGLFVNDWFIAAPSSATTILTLIQLALHAKYRSKPKVQFELESGDGSIAEVVAS